MRRFFTAKYWKRNVPKIRTPTGRAQLVENLGRRLWPRIIRPASGYRRMFARRTRVVAIIGSLGKTTTTRAVAAALGIPARRVTDQNAFASVAFAVLRILPWHRHAAIEVGIGGPGQMAVYRDIVQPDIVVVTSVASEHLRSFRTLEVTRTEKAEMLRNLPPSGLVVLNGDDPNVLWMREATRARIVTCGFAETNDVRATDVVFDWPRGMVFRLQAPGVTATIRTGLIGRRFIFSALAAIAVGLEERVALPKIARGLESVRPVEQRLAPVVTPSGAILLRDDFKSALESMDDALDVLFEIPARRKIVVFGDVTDCPGNIRETYRRLGDRIGRGATQAIFLGSANCQAYSAAAFRAGMPREAMKKLDDDVTAAIAALPADLSEGDVVLIKGRHTQRLGRIALALLGRKVKCRIASCPIIDTVTCDKCELLESGWKHPLTGKPM
jgi:UDP-N-acetylmuramyl pentapeptide synthase